MRTLGFTGIMVWHCMSVGAYKNQDYNEECNLNMAWINGDTMVIDIQHEYVTWNLNETRTEMDPEFLYEWNIRHIYGNRI